MALGKHLVQAKLFVYALQFLTGNLNNNHQWFHLHVLYMYVNYVVWSTTLVAKAAEMVAKASIVLSNHYWCLNIDYWGPNNCTYYTAVTAFTVLSSSFKIDVATDYSSMITNQYP